MIFITVEALHFENYDNIDAFIDEKSFLVPYPALESRNMFDLRC